MLSAFGGGGVNILFTSVGRRVELVQVFHHAADRLGIQLEIYGADITESAPALTFCDHTVNVPKIKEPAYSPACRRFVLNSTLMLWFPPLTQTSCFLRRTGRSLAVLGSLLASLKRLPCVEINASRRITSIQQV